MGAVCPRCGSDRIEHHEDVVARRCLLRVDPDGVWDASDGLQRSRRDQYYTEMTDDEIKQIISVDAGEQPA